LGKSGFSRSKLNTINAVETWPAEVIDRVLAEVEKASGTLLSRSHTRRR
jgi:hypothetical protein